MGHTVDLTLHFILDILSVRQQAGLNLGELSAQVSGMVKLGDKFHFDKGCACGCRIIALDDVLQPAIIAVVFDDDWKWLSLHRHYDEITGRIEF
jgi:hypothetical protein